MALYKLEFAILTPGKHHCGVYQQVPPTTQLLSSIVTYKIPYSGIYVDIYLNLCNPVTTPLIVQDISHVHHPLSLYTAAQHSVIC